MLTKFVNANIITLESLPFFGQLVVDGNKIVFIGENADKFTDGCNECRVIDCQGDYLLPAFTNTHTHLGMTGLRGLADDLPLKDWLQKKIFPLEKLIDEDFVRASVRLALAELISGGVTGVIDMYMYPYITAQVIEESGIFGIVSYGDNDLSTSVEECVSRQKRLLAYDFRNKSDCLQGDLCGTDYFGGKEKSRIGISNQHVFGALSFHAEYTCSESYLDAIADLSQEMRKPVMFHCSETLDEVGRCASRHDDLSPIMYLHSLGLLDHGGLAVHCVHCDKDDLRLMKQIGVAISVNSSSNCKLGSGFPPVYSMKDVGNIISLGTDSAVSNNRLDMWREMYLAAVLPKAVLNTPQYMTSSEVLDIACIGGANVFQTLVGVTNGSCYMFDSKSKNDIYFDGTLKVGGIANILRIDSKNLAMNPCTDFSSNLVYCGGTQGVRMTMCDGRILYSDGQFFNGWNIDNIINDMSVQQKRILEK